MSTPMTASRTGPRLHSGWGLVGTMLIVGTMVLIGVTVAGYELSWSCSSIGVHCVGGIVAVLWNEDSAFSSRGWHLPHSGWVVSQQVWRRYGAIVSLEPGAVYCPLWIPALLGVVLLFVSRRHRRPQMPESCTCCGYCLAGNVSGRCPECGHEVRAEGTEPGRSGQ
jgi:hypothetical protein